MIPDSEIEELKLEAKCWPEEDTYTNTKHINNKQMFQRNTLPSKIWLCIFADNSGL